MKASRNLTLPDCPTPQFVVVSTFRQQNVSSLKFKALDLRGFDRDLLQGPEIESPALDIGDTKIWSSDRATDVLGALRNTGSHLRHVLKADAIPSRRHDDCHASEPEFRQVFSDLRSDRTQLRFK